MSVDNPKSQPQEESGVEKSDNTSVSQTEDEDDEEDIVFTYKWLDEGGTPTKSNQTSNSSSNQLLRREHESILITKNGDSFRVNKGDFIYFYKKKNQKKNQHQQQQQQSSDSEGTTVEPAWETARCARIEKMFEIIVDEENEKDAKDNKSENDNDNIDKRKIPTHRAFVQARLFCKVRVIKYYSHNK